MLRRFVGVFASLALLFTVVPATPAEAYYVRTYTRPVTRGECALARKKTYKARTMACSQMRVTIRVKVTYGMYIGPLVASNGLTAASTDVSVRPLGCAPFVDPGCAGPPNPATWYFAQSWIQSRGPFDIWMMTTHYGVKFNGYQVFAVGEQRCDTFTFGLSIDQTNCNVINDGGGLPLGYADFGAHWRMCFVNKELGFCQHRGHREGINKFGQIVQVKKW